MLIALFKKTKKLRGSVSAMSKAKGKAEAEDIMYKNRGISIETSPNDGTLSPSFFRNCCLAHGKVNNPLNCETVFDEVG